MNSFYSHYTGLFKALSDETRLCICGLVAKQETCACDLLKKLSITQPTLSYHMKILCETGLVRARKDGPWIRYTLDIHKMQELEQFFIQLIPPSTN